MDPIDLASVDIAVSKPSDATMNDDDKEQAMDRVLESTTSAENTAIDKDISRGSESVDVLIPRDVGGSDGARGADGEMLHASLNEAVSSDAGLESDSQIVSNESNDSKDSSLQNSSGLPGGGDGDQSVDDANTDLKVIIHQQIDGEKTHIVNNPVKQDASSQGHSDNSSSFLVVDASESNQHNSEHLTQQKSTGSPDEMPGNETSHTALSNAATDKNYGNQQNDTTNPTAKNTTITDTAQSLPSIITTEEDNEEEEEPAHQILVDYASKVSGGQILEKSPSLKGTSNLLTGDMDRYAIAPCQDKKYVVIGLSEDILVKIIKLANYERYSSHVKDFQVLSSQEYPVPSDQWTDLGTYTALSKSGEQTFELKDAAWARYLKFKFLSHYGVEHYCTVSQIKVHGSTMLQGFHEQWIESEKMERGDDLEGAEREHKGVEERSDQGEEVELVEGGDWSYESAEVESTAGSSVNEELDEVSSGITASPVAVEERNNTDGDLVSSDERGECVKDDLAADSNDKEKKAKDGCKTKIDRVDVGDADSYSKDASSQNSSISILPSQVEPDEQDTKQKVSSSNALPSSASEFVDESNIVDEGKAAASSADDHTITSASNEETTAKNEKNNSIYAVADAVKAAMADASDAIKSVKEAVQSADAVTEIKKMIRTTIAVIDEEHKTEVDILEIGNVSIDGSDMPPNDIKTVDDHASHLNEKPDRMTSRDNISLTAHDDKLSNESGLKEIRINVEENATKVLNEIHVSGKEDATKTDPRTSSNSEAADDKSKATSNTSTLKVEPTATHPRQRNTINAASVDHIAKLLSRYPNASCIKSLDFQTFKSKSLLTNVVPGSAVGGAKMEPIFQKITSEIKSVQTTQHQHEQFISTIKACYENVLADIATDLDTIQSKFNARLTVLEMMLLERSDVRRNHHPAFFGFPVPVTFPLSTISALLPFPMIFNSCEGICICVAIVLFFVLIRRLKRKRNVTGRNALNSDLEGLSSASPTAADTVTQVEIPTGKKCHFEDDISPLPISAMKDPFHSNNLPTDISHDISCGESDCSTPSISLSEPIGTATGLDDPTSLAAKNGNHRNRFRIRRRAKSDGTRSP